MSVPTMRPPEQAPIPTRRRHGGLPAWAWVLIALGVVGLGLAACAALAVGMNTYLTHDLLHEDFSTSDGTFGTGTQAGHTFAVQDGAYVITANTASARPAFSYAYLARTAYALRAEADVLSAGDTAVGIGCATDGGEEGYYLVVDSQGRVAMLYRFGSESLPDDEPLATSDLLDVGTVRSLRLDCVDEAVGNAVRLTGYVNGEQVVQATDEQEVEGFATVFLAFVTTTAGVSGTFDNVDVTVPE